MNKSIYDKIKGKYGFTILPRFGIIHAEIYEIATMGTVEQMHIQLVSKEFKGWFRKTNEKDYIDAKLWVEDQLNNIIKANDL